MKKVFLLVLFLFCLAMEGCSSTSGVNECNHNYEKQETVQANCYHGGYTNYRCSLCGKIKTEDNTEALQHEFVEGPDTYICNKCGHFQDEGFDFKLNPKGTEYEIIGCGNDAIHLGVVDIPLKHYGIPVTKISNKAFYSKRYFIKELRIHKNIRTIEGCLFETTTAQKETKNPIALETVVFDSDCSNIEISRGAFNQCYILSKVEFTVGCFSVITSDTTQFLSSDRYLFQDTVFFKQQAVLEDGMFYIKDLLLASDVDKLSSNIEIKTGTRIIGNYVFYKNTNLKSVSIPQSVVAIGYGAFIDCANLSEYIYKGTKTQFEEIRLNGDVFYRSGLNGKPIGSQANATITYLEGK